MSKFPSSVQPMPIVTLGHTVHGSVVRVYRLRMETTWPSSAHPAVLFMSRLWSEGSGKADRATLEMMVVCLDWRHINVPQNDTPRNYPVVTLH